MHKEDIDKIKYTACIWDGDRRRCIVCGQAVTQTNILCPSCNKKIALTGERENDESEEDYRLRFSRMKELSDEISEDIEDMEENLEEKGTSEDIETLYIKYKRGVILTAVIAFVSAIVQLTLAKK